MKFKPYTNRPFEVMGVTRHPRNQDKLTRRACISPYILPGFDRSMRIKWAGLDIDSYRIGSYVHVE